MSKRLGYFFAAFTALLSFALTFVELFSDLRALGRQATVPFFPVIAFDGLMDIFRSLNLLCIVFILFKLANELPLDNSKRKIIQILLSTFLLLSLLGPLGPILNIGDSIGLIALLALFITYPTAMILLALARKAVEQSMDEISILLLLIGILLPLIILSYLIAGFGLQFLLTVMSRGLLFIMMFILIIKFSKKAIAR